MIAIILIVVYILLVKGESIKRLSRKPIKSILFIGDSNTVASYSYADKLKNMFPGLSIKKIAQVGEKTDWMYKQLIDELNKSSYDLVAILGGSNDIYALNSIDSAKENLNNMYRFAKSKGSQVLAITPPNKDFYVNKTDQKQVLLDSLNDWIKNNPNKDYFVDFHKITDDKSFFSSADGYLHANSNAHDILANQTKQVLNLA